MVTVNEGRNLVEVTAKAHGRADRPLTREQLEAFFHALWTAEAASLPTYPQVRGGVAIYYENAEGYEVSVDSLQDLLESYDFGIPATITILGSIWYHPYVRLWYRCNNADATITVRANGREIADQYIEEFTRYFPRRPFNALDIHLQQRAYTFQSPPIQRIPDYRQFYRRHARLQQRDRLGQEYGHFFERFVGDVLRYDFGMTVGINYRIQREGQGGDYDVLALNDARELFYFECKSGANVTKRDFQNFYRRHKFLHPAAGIVVFDEPKASMLSMITRMRQVLIDEEKIVNPAAFRDPNFQYSNFAPIPSTDRDYSYHIRRNLFFISGEDIPRGIAHCIRYYDAVVKQSSYWG